MERHASSARRLLGVTILGCLLAGTAFAQNPKRFFVGPAYSGGLEEYEKLFDPDAQWTWVKRHAQFFEFHVHSWMLSPNFAGYLDDKALRAAAHTIRQTDLKVSVEAGGLRSYTGNAPSNWNQAGELRAKLEVAAYKRWRDAGGRLDVIVLDSPFSKVLRDMGMPWDYAAHELADYLDIVKLDFPHVEISLIEPVPHYRLGAYRTWGGTDFGDLGELLDTVLPILESRGHRIESFTADAPYTFIRQTALGWEKLVAVQKLVQDVHNRRFGWFVNDSKGGKKSAQLYSSNSIKALEEFRQAGGDADDFNLRGWFAYPKTFVPESDEASFMGIARKLMHHVYGNYEAPNAHNVTLTFEDGALGRLQRHEGTPQLNNGGLVLRSNGKLRVRRLRYADPTVAIVGDMIGMPRGSSMEIGLEPDHTGWAYKAALVVGGDTTSRVRLEAIDTSTGTTQTLALGPQLPVDPQVSEVRFVLKQRNGLLTVTVDGYEGLSVLPPTRAPVEVSIGATFVGPQVGRARFDVVDLRDRDGVASVEIDMNGHVIFSLLSDDLLPNFQFPYYLNTYEGTTLSYSEFEAGIFPFMEVQTLSRDHVVLRSTVPVPSGALIGLVYDGDFEVVRRTQ